MTAAALRLDEVAPILRALGGTGAVLIGGQALNLWCERYAKRVDALRESAPFTSKDVDAQGDRRALDACAWKLNASAVYPDHEDTTNSGYVAVTLGGKTIELQFLVHPFGLTQREADDTAIHIEVADFTLRVLHPVLVMESRIANVMGLHRTDAHSLGQARASIHCAREFMCDLVNDGHIDDALALAERVFRYARKSRPKRAFTEHGLDAFSVVQPYPALPPMFVTQRYPVMQTQIEAQRALAAVEAERVRAFRLGGKSP